MSETMEKSNLKWVNNIPGWMSEKELAAIDALYAEAASMIKPFSPPFILEIGSFLGRSAMQWARQSPHTKVVCVDPWMGEVEQFAPGALAVLDGDKKLIRQGMPIYDQFILNTHSQPNIYPVRYYSNEFDWIFGNPPSIIFIDGDHSEAGITTDVRMAIENWSRGNKKCIIAGHDYGHPQMPHIKRLVDDIAVDYNLHVEHMEDTMIFALRGW